MDETSPPNACGHTAVEISLDDRVRLLESAERLAQLGGWEWPQGANWMHWSDNLYRIFGVQRHEVSPSLEFVLSQTHPDDRYRVERHSELVRSGTYAPIEFRIVPPGGGVRYLRSTMTIIEQDERGPKRVVGSIQDVTDELLATQELAAHVAVSKVLTDWQTFEESGQRLLGGIAEALQFVHGALWLPDGDLLRARLRWSDSSADSTAFEVATRELRIPRGVGFLGRVWERKAPVSVVDVLVEPNYRHRPAAAEAGLRGAAAFPVVYAGEVLAVLEFYKREEYYPSAGVTRTMIAIGAELGQFLSRRQGQLLYSSPLTPRELQVLQLVADGYSRSQVADLLTVSSATIASHMQHIFESLGVRDRASAVAAAIRLGLIE